MNANERELELRPVSSRTAALPLFGSEGPGLFAEDDFLFFSGWRFLQTDVHFLRQGFNLLVHFIDLVDQLGQSHASHDEERDKTAVWQRIHPKKNGKKYDDENEFAAVPQDATPHVPASVQYNNAAMENPEVEPR
jgi:hypothetical protein